MHSDSEGFAYPQVDKHVCFDCGLCEQVCPVLNRNTPKLEPKSTFAVQSRDMKQRMTSSSGGVFSLLSQQVIGRGGVVFGARFNDQWQVVHGYAQTMEEVGEFRGSKYVQSDIGESLTNAKRFLREGREVLFSGSPCQIAGLRNYLGREYDNLLTVDFVCHGVPSPLVFEKYIAEISGCNIDNIALISFRDKSAGWAKYRTLITDSRGRNLGRTSGDHKDVFLNGFLRNVYLRPSCHACPSRGLSSGSDIVLGDYWGVDSVLKDFSDDRGCSLVIVCSDRGEMDFESMADRVESVQTEFEHLRKLNPSLFEDSKASPKRNQFFAKLGAGSVCELIEECVKESFTDHVLRRVKKYLR